MTGMDTRDADLKKELNATLQARRELGEEYESALVDSFLEKVDQRIDGAVERRVRRQLAEQQMTVARDSRSPKATDSWGERFGFGIVSLVLAVPLSAIGAGTAPPPRPHRRLVRHRRRQRRPGRAEQPRPSAAGAAGPPRTTAGRTDRPPPRCACRVAAP